MNLANLHRIVRDCLAEGDDYPQKRDWALRLYDRLLSRWTWAPLPFRRKVCHIYKKGIAEPFALRLGSSDWPVLNEIFVQNEYDALLKRDIGNPRWIVDLGSNIGLSLRLWLQHYPEARILAVEPDPDNARVLQMNVRGPDSNKIILVEACVLGHARPVQLQAGVGDWAYSVKDMPGDSVNSTGKIAAFTMSELLNKHCGDATIDLLKCDIEGTEAELFRNCREWLGKVRFAMVELHGDYRLKDLEKDTMASGVPIEILWREESTDQSLILFRTRGADLQ